MPSINSPSLGISPNLRMQIEFIGCTGAGKSSLIQQILRHNPHMGFNLVTSYDFVLNWAHCGWISEHRTRMLILNFIALIACLVTWQKNQAFLRFTFGYIWRLPTAVPFVEKIKLTRITARNVGIYEIIRYHNSDRQVILADEGTLQIAHYLFVHVSVEPDLNALDRFIQLANLPDAAAYICEDVSDLIARTSVRSHKRIPGGAPALVTRFIQRGLAVFENLTASSSVLQRLLVINQGKLAPSAQGYGDNPRINFAREIIAIGLDPIKEKTVEVQLEY